MTERILDWRPRFDERSRAFRLSAVKGKTRKIEWRHGPVLDQGSEGACVGFAAAANLASTKRQRVFVNGNKAALGIYKAAQKLDEWAGEDYPGTSVLAGMKVLAAQADVKRYEWAFTTDDVLWALSWRGPVQIGVWWYEGMFDTDHTGYLHVEGKKAGGHSTLLSGINPEQEYVTITNSWGEGWGSKGQARLSFKDLEFLLSDGEAVSILKPKL